jgi:hypothetical protein
MLFPDVRSFCRGGVGARLSLQISRLTDSTGVPTFSVSITGKRRDLRYSTGSVSDLSSDRKAC